MTSPRHKIRAVIGLQEPEGDQWDRDALREQCFEQSARTVAGARAEFKAYEEETKK